MSGFRVSRFKILSILVGKEFKPTKKLQLPASTCSSIGYGFLIFVITSCDVSEFVDLDKLGNA